jgi:DeoR family fructose operon transcriptional repressor
MSIGPITPSPERPGLRVVGPVRYAAERQRIILAAARADGRVEVTDLAQRLEVTGETIRRDLTVLERRGLVRRVHGGALPVE